MDVNKTKNEKVIRNTKKSIREIKESNKQPYMTCFGIDIYEKNGELISEYENV